jgi:hypothetical protein
VRRPEELKLWDKLVFVVQHEMGRTPTFDNQGGKDPWSVGSIMLLGPGFRGNQVIGATDEQQCHGPINPHTLARDQAAGILDHPHSKKFPFVIPEKERLVGLL